VERAGSAVELRPAPKARYAAHPQERQHDAAEGGRRDRTRPELPVRKLRKSVSCDVGLRIFAPVLLRFLVSNRSCPMTAPSRAAGPAG
jgi:hypothetical protein